MLPYEPSVPFFETLPVLEVDQWQVGSWDSYAYDLIDVLPAVRKRGDTGNATVSEEGTVRGDARWMLDYWWEVSNNWDAGTTVGARNRSVMHINMGLNVTGAGQFQRAVPFPGIGPLIRYGDVANDTKRSLQSWGTIRLRGRIFQVTVSNTGTNVPLQFHFGAYLRAV